MKVQRLSSLKFKYTAVGKVYAFEYLAKYIAMDGLWYFHNLPLKNTFFSLDTKRTAVYASVI